MSTSTQPKAEERPKRKKWTLLLYMAASHDHKLEAAAIRDLHEIERVPGGHDFNVLAFVDRAWPGSQVYRIDGKDWHQVAIPDGCGKPSTLIIKSGTGMRSTLESFLVSALEEAPAEQYALVLWGHAYGLGFGREHGDPLTIIELREALEAFQRARSKDGEHVPTLDLLAANACAMSYVEAAYELKDVVEYLASSQVVVPFAGLPYDVILRGMRQAPDTETLGRLIVDAYTSSFAASSNRSLVTMTLLDLKEADHLASLVRDLSVAIAEHVSPGGRLDVRRLADLRDVFFGAATGDVRSLLDVKQMCRDLVSLRSASAVAGRPSHRRGSVAEAGPTEPLPLATAAERLSVFVSTEAPVQSAQALTTHVAVAADAGWPDDVRKGGGRKGNSVAVAYGAPAPRSPRAGGQFVVQYNPAPDVDNLNGLGVFAPFVMSDDQLKRLGLGAADARRETGMGTYLKLLIFRNEQLGAEGRLWPKLVYDVLRQDVPGSAVDCVESCGAIDSAHRSDVAQLVIQLHSVFNKFERSVTLCQEHWTTTTWPDSTLNDRRAPATQFEEVVKKLEELELLDPAILKTVASRALKAKGKARPVDVHRVGQIVESLRWTETSLASLEKTLRRILTSESYGLGPPKGSDGLGFRPKGSGGMGQDSLTPKGSGGMGFDNSDPKGSGGMGASGDDDRAIGIAERALGTVDLRGAKSGLAAMPAMVASSDEHGARAVAALFGLVAQSLRSLEIALANAEAVVVTNATDTGVFSSVSRARFNRAFRLLDEASGSARRTVVLVMGHPIYGLGPGAAGVEPEMRRELAVAGGLSGGGLRLL